MPPKDFETGTYKQHLSLSLMAHIFPEWAQADADRAVKRCLFVENPSMSCALQLDPEMIKDCVLQKEHSEISNYVAQLQQAAKKKVECRSVSKAIVSAHLKKKGSAPKKKP